MKSNRREQILQVARHLFLTKNYEATTMVDIMDALEIAKGTIYHYFSSKEALLEAVIDDIVDKMVRQMELTLKKSSGKALEKMEQLVKAGQVAQENEKLLEQLHKPANGVLHTRLLASTIMRLAPLYAQVIEQGCEEGVFQTQAPLECAEFILSAVQFLTDMGIYPWTEGALKRRAEAFPKLIEELLSAPSDSFQFLLK